MICVTVLCGNWRLFHHIFIASFKVPYCWTSIPRFSLLRGLSSVFTSAFPLWSSLSFTNSLSSMPGMIPLAMLFQPFTPLFCCLCNTSGSVYFVSPSSPIFLLLRWFESSSNIGREWSKLFSCQLWMGISSEPKPDDDQKGNFPEGWYYEFNNKFAGSNALARISVPPISCKCYLTILLAIYWQSISTHSSSLIHAAASVELFFLLFSPERSGNKSIGLTPPGNTWAALPSSMHSTVLSCLQPTTCVIVATKCCRFHFSISCFPFLNFHFPSPTSELVPFVPPSWNV